MGAAARVGRLEDFGEAAVSAAVSAAAGVGRLEDFLGAPASAAFRFWRR